MLDEPGATLREIEVLPASGAEHYREIASRLRKLAEHCPFAYARLELAQLAVKFDGRADRFQKGWAL
jgi:hypothetical protein